YAGTRIIFTDTEASNWTKDPVADAYYWHRFFSHQPDLNFDNPRVHEEVFAALDFWMEKGVDGLRLDAVPYLYEREGTNNENLPETHEFLKKLRAHNDARFTNRMLLAEANQWPEDSIAYFGDPDKGEGECHMAFHFPVMPRLFMAIRMEDRVPIVDILQQTPPIPESCQWATFLRNHDELTLEMVTDEDRDYMYRVYAADKQQRINVGIRRRLAPLLGNDRRRIELMNALLFSLPGTPVLYYGDEIGMGDNFYLGDRNGVRTPMQWSADKNAGFSRANPQQLYLPVIVDPTYHYEAVNVEAQQSNPYSLLWWTKRLIALRKRHKAFSRGTLEFLHPENYHVLAFLRRHEGETLLVLANLSRFAQHVELDLGAFAGATPVELFGRNRFPQVQAGSCYALTLGPHGFYWFSLQTDPAEPGRPHEGALPDRAAALADLPVLALRGRWDSVFDDSGRADLAAALAAALPSRRWFGGKARRIAGAQITEAIPLGNSAEAAAWIALVQVGYANGEPETYVVPLAFAAGEEAERVLAAGGPPVAVARVESPDVAGAAPGLLYEPTAEPAFWRLLLESIADRRRFRGARSDLAAWPTAVFAEIHGEGALEPVPLRSEQSNTSARFGDRFVLKLFRRVEAGVNPDQEIGQFLTEQTTFRHSPRVAGGLEIRQGRSGEPITVGSLQEFIPNEGDAWAYTRDALGRYFERVRTGWGRGEHGAPAIPSGSYLDLARREPDGDVAERIGTYLPMVRLLGERTAELHIALAGPGARDFEPEPFSELYQRSLYQSMRSLTKKNFRLLRQKLGALPAESREPGEAVLAEEEKVLTRFERLLDRRFTVERIRCHGDYHLGQVLYTGKDFVILDFEGEPTRSVSERRLKRSPLRDVAGMLRSFQYAAYARLLEERETGVLRSSDLPEFLAWSRYWERWVSGAFLRSYLERAGTASFVPADPEELAILLEAFVLEKAVYELDYELNNRPDWVRIPLQGIRQILGDLEG
ncbi:MAG TPA: putative maltokinase, partial [Thermoanaerobaculia bacterium]|nr:putative maltokinase [Thermoanaerobaculia bacterium]